VDVDGDLAVLRRSSSGDLTLTRYAAADGSRGYAVDLGRGEDATLGRLGPDLLVATTDGDRRTYRAVEPATGAVRWEVGVDEAEGPDLPDPQLSPDHAVLVLRDVPAYLTVTLDDGATRRDEGLILATDEDTAYVAADGGIVARALATGEERWRTTDVRSAASSEDPSPGRLGVVLTDKLVVATADAVVGLDRDAGTVEWRRPLSDDGLDMGEPLAVSTAAGRIIVSTEGGDLGLSGEAGIVTWRKERDRLVLDPVLDREQIRSDGGEAIWFGEGSRLIAGWNGARLWVIDSTRGQAVGDVDLPPTDGRSSVAAFQTGLALLAGNRVTAYSNSDGDVLWDAPAEDATTVVAIDGGVVLAGPSGLRAVIRG
jgi:outer membrane protein assembly factor BamB